MSCVVARRTSRNNRYLECDLVMLARFFSRWARSNRCWFTEESISEAFEDRRCWELGRPLAYEGVAAEHAARIIDCEMTDRGVARKRREPMV